MPVYGYGFLIGIAFVVIFWFLFIAPMERRMHERKMELMRRKLERNEKRLRELRENGQAETDVDIKMPANTESVPGENERFAAD